MLCTGDYAEGTFLPNEFVPTQFSTSAEKANFGNTLLHFLDANCARELFTKFVNRLSMTFGHIAHYVEGVIMRSVNTKTAGNGAPAPDRSA